MSDETPKWEKRTARNEQIRSELKAARAKLEKPKRIRSPLQYVYFIRSQEFVKIGWATAMETRLNSCQVNNPHLIELLALMAGGPTEEATLHAYFRSDHHRGEWFRLSGAIMALIDEIMLLEPIDARVRFGEWIVRNTGSREMLVFPRNIRALRGRDNVPVALPDEQKV